MMDEFATFPSLRVVLIHALRASLTPIHAAFERCWPQAEVHDLLDSSLSADRAAGMDVPTMTERFLSLGRYAAQSRSRERATSGILFTCSAFGREIDAVRRDLGIPVVKPNEAAFVEAAAIQGRVGLIVTFEPALASLTAELHDVASAQGTQVDVAGCMVPDAMAALQNGDADRHDALVARAAKDLQGVRVIVLGQFSTARAAAAVAQSTGLPVITTPDSAVRRLRDQLVAATSPRS
jgi:Asp/Glu/hydantoin racemase